MAVRIKSQQDRIKKRAVIEELKEKGYDKNVIFVDSVNNVARWFNISDLNIFPARKMQGKFDIPYAVIESMACKKPVVVSDLPVLKEFIKDGENGLVVKKADPKALTSTIEEMKNSPVALDRIGSNARRYVEENFDIKKTAEKYAKVYEML